MLRLISNHFLRCVFLLVILGGCDTGSNGNDALSVDLKCDQADVTYNSDVILTWSTNKAESCTASESWKGEKNISGAETIAGLTTDSSFTLTCTNSSGDTALDNVTVTVAPIHAGTASLSWTPPTKNTDGSKLTDLAGYKIYMGTTPGTYRESIIVNDNGIDTYVVENLSAATWYFAVSAVDTDGNESEKSNEASKVIPIQ